MFNLHTGREKDDKKVDKNTAEAFARLYREHFPKVFRYISYRINDISTVEDLTSAVFEKAITKFASYREEKSSFGTWIITIARNTIIDHYRSEQQKKEIHEEDLNFQNEAVSPDDAIICAEERQLLQQCISRLSPVEQEIISLKFGGEITNREIARQLGLSESNVGVILYRAVRKLREFFRDNINE